MTSFNIPVALFNFNRPHLTRQVFEIVRQVKPKRLLLVADGPRADRPNDARLCAEVRAIIEAVDWECEVSKNFADTNMGSFKRNSSGLNWVFDTVEEAIILEDDCVPSLSFFPYCAELLERYRDDPRIAVISGNSFVPPGPDQADASYFYSAYALTWGWASWRRVWKQVDLGMTWWTPETGKRLLKAAFPKFSEWRYWFALYERIHRGEMKNAWDYQLILSAFRHSQYCIIPGFNMISNTGFGVDGTNCLNEFSPLQDVQRVEMQFPLVHPASIQRNDLMDYMIFKMRFDSAPLHRKAITRVASVLPAEWRVKIKDWLLNHIGIRF